MALCLWYFKYVCCNIEGHHISYRKEISNENPVDFGAESNIAGFSVSVVWQCAESPAVLRSLCHAHRGLADFSAKPLYFCGLLKQVRERRDLNGSE